MLRPGESPAGAGTGKAVRQVSGVAVVVVAVVMGLAAVSIGYAGCPMTVRNATGALVARIGTEGTVRDSSGRVLGTVEGALVRDRTGGLLGRLDAGGTVRDRTGKLLARMDGEGELRGPSGMLLLKIDSKGRIRDPKGRLAGWLGGYLPACRNLAAAYLVFFGVP